MCNAPDDFGTCELKSYKEVGHYGILKTIKLQLTRYIFYVGNLRTRGEGGKESLFFRGRLLWKVPKDKCPK